MMGDACDEQFSCQSLLPAVILIRLLLLLAPLPFLLFQETIIVLPDSYRARMLRSKGPCVDRQRALVERLRLLVLALRIVEIRQVVEAARRAGVHLAQLLLTDRQ